MFNIPFLLKGVLRSDKRSHKSLLANEALLYHSHPCLFIEISPGKEKKKQPPNEEMIMNHSNCGTAQIKHHLNFHVIIRLSWRFQITFRTALILSPQTPAQGQSNHENGNSSGSFCLAFLGLEWHLVHTILDLSSHFDDCIIQPLSAPGHKAYSLKQADLLRLV